MGKKGFEGLRSVAELLGQLLDGKTLTARSIAKQLGIGHAAGARRLAVLAELPHAIAGTGRERSLRLPMLLKQSAVGDGAVAAACLVSAVANAVQETTMARQVERLRDEWVSKSRSGYATEHLDRKFWFVGRGGEKALPKAENRLADIITALLAEEDIVFDYVHFNGKRDKAVRAQPLTLALHEHQFYVICLQGNAPPHPFRFARMTNLRRGKKVPYPDEGAYHPKRLFQSVFGIFIGQPDESVQRVRLRFAPKWRGYVKSHRWHHTQQEREVDEEGTTEVELEVRVCHELRAWILGLGADVEVLAPASLREETRLALERAAALYRAGNAPGVAATRRKPAAVNPAPRARTPRRAAR